MELKDTVPPHNMEAEQAVLGALLLDWDSLPTIISYIKPDCFYEPRNKLIYEAMLALFSKGAKADAVTMVEELTKAGNLNQAGGAAYVAGLTSVVPTSANIEYYAKIVLDQYTRRSLINISQDIKASSYDETIDSREVLEGAEESIFSLTDISQTSTIIKMIDIVPQTINALDQRVRNRKAFTGIASGLSKLDDMLGGFHDGEMVVVGARPSMGKTALALSMIQNIILGDKVPTGFFSLEMAANQIMFRLLSQVSKVPGFKLRNAQFTSGELQSIEDAAATLYGAPLFVVDTPNMKLLDLRALARRMVSSLGVKIIFIDYIGLVTCENTKLQLFEQVSEISRSLKSLARELNVPLVALCQVARDAEGQEPTLNQLRGSGSIEQDADVVMFIHRERKVEKDENDKPRYAQEAKIIVAKQRNGPIGDVPVIFIPSCTRFENAEDTRQS